MSSSSGKSSIFKILKEVRRDEKTLNKRIHLVAFKLIEAWKKYLGFLTYNNVFSSGQILSDRNQIQIVSLCTFAKKDMFLVSVFALSAYCVDLITKEVNLTFSPRQKLGIGMWHRELWKSLTLRLWLLWASCQHFYFIVWYRKNVKISRWIPEHAHTIDISQTRSITKCIKCF